jgi:transcriptional regulator with XRE-family HTH domain
VNKHSNFDFEGFFRSLDATREARKKTWKDVGAETSVSSSTLARMGANRRPDADGLASLAKWSGLNPADFVTYATAAPTSSTLPRETIAEISRLLRSDAALKDHEAAVLEDMIRAAYARFASTGQEK